MQELDVTERITDSVELDTIKTPSHVSLYYNNIRGMSSKKDHILLSTTSCDYDLIVLSETWLKEGKFSAEFFDPRFTVYRKDRSDSNIDASKGGGVLVAIDSKYDSEVVNVPELSRLEAICIKLHLQSSNSYMYIYGLYIQHGSTAEVYQTHLEAIIAAQ